MNPDEFAEFETSEAEFDAMLAEAEERRGTPTQPPAEAPMTAPLAVTVL